jgi:hypothetical protein
MSFRNSLKLLLNNFSSVWKLLWSKLVVFIVSASLIVAFVLPTVISIFNSVAGTGLFENAWQLLDDFINRADMQPSVEALKNSLDMSSKVLADNAGKLSVSYFSVLAILIFSNLISGLANFAMSDVMNVDMCANAKLPFMSRFIITLGKGIRYQLVRLITEIPLFIIVLSAVWQIFSFLFSLIGILSVFFSVALFFLLIAACQTFFCCWLPEVTVNRGGVFEAIKKGFALAKPHYFNLLSVFLLADFFVFLTNAVLAFFTCGAGLIISIPMSILFYIILKLVIYYDLRGLKYYIDSNTIVIPVDEDKDML